MIYKPLTNKSTPLIIEDIRECLKEDLPSQITIDTGDLPHLIGEIERLNNDIKVLLKENENKEKVIKAQDNIIKEVREYIKENMKIISKGQAEDTRLPVGTFMWNVDKVLEILDKEKE